MSVQTFPSPVYFDKQLQAACPGGRGNGSFHREVLLAVSSGHHPVSDVCNFLLVHNMTWTEGGTAWVPEPPASPPESSHPSTSPLLCAGALTFPHVPKPAPAEGAARGTVLGNTWLTEALTPLSSAVAHAFQSLKTEKNGKILGIRKLNERRALLETF